MRVGTGNGSRRASRLCSMRPSNGIAVGERVPTGHLGGAQRPGQLAQCERIAAHSAISWSRTRASTAPGSAMRSSSRASSSSRP